MTNNWTQVGTGNTYTVTASDVYGARYIKYEVTPKAITDNPALQTGKTESIILGPVPAGEIAPQASNIRFQRSSVRWNVRIQMQPEPIP